MKAMRLLLWMLVLFGCAAHGGVHASSGESSKSGNVAILRHITKGKPSKKSPYRQAYVAQRQEKKHNHNIVMEARKADLKEAIRGPKAHKMDMPENRDAQQVRGNLWRFQREIVVRRIANRQCAPLSTLIRLSPPLAAAPKTINLLGLARAAELVGGCRWRRRTLAAAHLTVRRQAATHPQAAGRAENAAAVPPKTLRRPSAEPDVLHHRRGAGRQ
jgi:hypothetical protein